MLNGAARLPLPSAHPLQVGGIGHEVMQPVVQFIQIMSSYGGTLFPQEVTVPSPTTYSPQRIEEPVCS